MGRNYNNSGYIHIYWIARSKLLQGTIVVVVLEPRWISKSRQSGRLDYLGHSTPAWGRMNNPDINGKTRVKLWHMEQDILIYRWFVFLYAEVCESFLIWTLFCFELDLVQWTEAWLMGDCLMFISIKGQWSGDAHSRTAPGPWTWIEAGLAMPAAFLKCSLHRMAFWIYLFYVVLENYLVVCIPHKWCLLKNILDLLYI